MKSKCILILCLFVLSISCKTEKKKFPLPETEYTSTVFPKPIGFINDFDSIFSEKEEDDLLKLVKLHEEATTNQIAVITINDLKGYDNIEQYSFDLANYWDVGLEDKNNGILITIHVAGRKIWIQNGDGIVAKLTDAETGYIIESRIIPEFKRNDYYKGVYRGIEAIIKELNKTEEE